MNRATQLEPHDAQVTAWKRQVTERILRMPREELAHLEELDGLLHATDDPEEKDEIVQTAMELIFPDALGEVADLESSVNSAARARVDEYRRRVGHAIRVRRRKLGMTQQQVADVAGIPQSHVSRIERGVHAATHVTIKKLAKALHTRPAKLDPGFYE